MTVLDHTDGETQTGFVSEEGVYEMPDSLYHADPVEGRSLSVSGAKNLLPPSCPAKFDYDRKNRPAPTQAFNFGHAAHSLVLGAGPEIVVIDADSWRTKAAKDARDKAFAEGKTPLLPEENEAVTAMARALREHPVASQLLNPDHGQPERALFCRDSETGIMRRSKVDWLPDSTPGRMILPDYKTSVDANPAEFGRNAAKFGYHMQAPWYEDMVLALGLASDVAFVFIVQEKTPPFIVQVIQLDPDDMAIGRILNRRALDLYAECEENDSWPTYSTEVEMVRLPSWYRYQFEETL